MTYEYENNNRLKMLISRINIKFLKKTNTVLSFKLRKLYTIANNMRLVPFGSRMSKIISIFKYSIV